MKTLSIDIETYSSEDLTKTGVHKYAEAEDFEILLFAYAYDDDPVEIIDLASGETLPVQVYGDLVNPTVLKTAFNANFEITCMNRAFPGMQFPDQWECTMVKSAMLGLPMSLDGVAKALNLEQQKMAAGRALIRYFSMPCKPTKSNGLRTRNLPHHDPDKWALFKEYCKQDVETERAIRNKERWFTIPRKERELWLLDQRIIGTGVLIDRRMVENAIRMDDDHKEILTAEATELTGLDNPNSPAQLKEWLTEQTGEEGTSLTKTVIPALLDASDSEEVTRVLELRQEMSKTSTKKYQAMLDAVCSDGRVRGLLQFYGASRTGRWCLTGDHEVLTDRGWVRLDEWQGGQIACWNSMGEAISFQKATPNEFNYEGEMVSVDCQRCAQLSTPEHTMPYWDNGWKSDEIQNLTKRFKMPFTGKKQNTQDFENYDLRVLIMTQADGHYTEWQDLKFHFTKTRKIERCKMLLRRAGIPFMLREHKNATVISVYHRHQPLYLRMFKNKVFGDWLLEENVDVFFDELEHWDSYRCGPNSIQYSSTVKQNVDIVQAMAALSGRSCTVVVKSRKESPSWSDAYVVNIWLTPGLHTEIRREFISRVSYSGKVYCPSTQTGFFMVRRNGKVWVTGNSGRNVQIQNLPQNHLPDLDLARETVIEGDRELVEMLYGNVPDTLSQLIRTAFVAPKGYRFIVADFSAIEARVTAWLAGEKWRLDVFASHGKIYEASASQMFKVPLDSIDKGSPLRQKGKIAELALGYQGGVGALKTMGGERMGLSEPEMQEIGDSWRLANPNIVRLWYDIQEAAMAVICNIGRTVEVKGCRFKWDKGLMWITLPSGRSLCYATPGIGRNRFGGDSITYWGINQTTRKWEKQETYGGKLVENLSQAIARDCLAHSMLRLDEEGFKIVMHVHDEVVIEEPYDGKTMDEACRIMGEPISWAPGLLLRADGYETEYYKKD